MLLLQCLAGGLYNTKPITSKLRNSSCVLAKPLELRRWYLIMLLLQSIARSGDGQDPQVPKLWTRRRWTCVPASPAEPGCAGCNILLLQQVALNLYSNNPQGSKLWMQCRQNHT